VAYTDPTREEFFIAKNGWRVSDGKEVRLTLFGRGAVDDRLTALAHERITARALRDLMTEVAAIIDRWLTESGEA
jgi:hypothetical protein